METKELLQQIDNYLLNNTTNNNLFNLFTDIKKYLTDISIPIEPPVKPDFTEITLNDYEKLGDTFIDAKTDPPLTQWRIIAGVLSSIGFKIIKK